MIEITMDQSGKVEVQGTEIEEHATRLVRKNGVLVVEAGPIDDTLRYYLEHAVELDREERMRKLMGENTQ